MATLSPKVKQAFSAAAVAALTGALIALNDYALHAGPILSVLGPVIYTAIVHAWPALGTQEAVANKLEAGK